MTTIQTLHSNTRGLGILALIVLCTEPIGAMYYSNTNEFTWILALSFLAGFMASYGIGANDVANSFATSVGAKSLTIFQSVSIASVCELLGAVLMGSQVTKTMRSGIADPTCFEDNPGLLMWGMFCVLCCTGGWLVLASTYEMPVSTTHSTVGGIIGMTMMVRGTDCVIWNESTDTFPYVKGVSAIVISWILSPICSGVISSIIYGITYFSVLKNRDISFIRTKYLFPFIVGTTVAINVGMFIIKGSKGKQDEFGTASVISNAKEEDGSELTIILLSTFGISVVSTYFIMPLLLKKVESKLNVIDQLFPSNRVEELDEQNKEIAMVPLTEEDEEIKKKTVHIDINQTFQNKIYVIYQYVKNEINKDPYDVIEESQITIDMHENCQRHNEDTEEMFKYVQVFSAIVGSLSHGANDVANAMGPFAAIFTIWKLNRVPTETEDIGENMYWILTYGGVGIVVGLATYGYKIISAMGVKLITVTPSRGYAIELGAAFMVMFGSVQGWPLSTTHCQVGATVGVGLFEGQKGVNPWILGKAIFGWFATLLMCGLGAALLSGPNPEYNNEIYQ